MAPIDPKTIRSGVIFCSKRARAAPNSKAPSCATPLQHQRRRRETGHIILPCDAVLTWHSIAPSDSVF